jgi:hypothetical protein
MDMVVGGKAGMQCKAYIIDIRSLSKHIEEQASESSDMKLE